MKNIFVTCINCIDGRVQKPLIEFATSKFKADYVDMITEPGPDKILSEEKDLNIIESIKRRIMISVEKHKSKVLIIAGHYDCAGNPVEKEIHYSQIKKAVENIEKLNLGVRVYGAWVDENWKAFLI